MRSTRIVLVAAFIACSLAFEGSENYAPELVDTPVDVVHYENPRLLHVKNFASDFEMDHIIKHSFENMRPQMQNTETGVVHELPINGDPILEAIEDRMKGIFQNEVGPKRDRSFKGDGGETLRVRRYLPDGVGFKGGDYHPPHTDWYELPGMGVGDALLITLMIYMTTPEEGGQTRFADANGGKGFDFQPRRGDLAIWWSCTKDGKQDMKSMHSAVPVKKGIKWNATRFLYDNTKKCSTEPTKTIPVPKVALSNVPQTDSMKTMWGTDMPTGVTTSAKGTYDAAAPPDPYADLNQEQGYSDAFSDEEEEEDEGADWTHAFMDSLNKDDLKLLAAEGMNDVLKKKMQDWMAGLTDQEMMHLRINGDAMKDEF